jgi:predicted ATPase/DNA-binding CsgD family transcriptional regulator
MTEMYVEKLSDREQEILRLIEVGLSNKQIAGELYLSYETVKWYNKQIYSKLGVNNRIQAVTKARQHGLLEEETAWFISSKGETAHNLPEQITSFVGREREVIEVKERLSDVRLLTLTGPGGTGKTRLALQVVSEMLDTFTDGVVFVNLASIGEPDQMIATIASSISLNEVKGQSIDVTLKKYLRNKNLLLLLDNFEHLIEAAPQVSELLSAAPTLMVLVTSREALNIYGEHLYPVPPLKIPDLDHLEPYHKLAENEAMALFIQRVKYVKPDFELNKENASSVAEICVRLDGLPLAIELAAARVKLFNPQSLVGQLRNRFTLLKDGPQDSPSRHRTLWGTMDWSFDLLEDAEKILFARLSVFQGGRTIEAAEKVCGFDLQMDVLDGLASLLNKSLLQQVDEQECEPRFIMLETIHEYARVQLEKMGETNAIRRRHASYFTAFAERVEPETRGGPQQMRWLRRLVAENGNLRAALDWSLGGADIQLGLRLVGALGFFWYRHIHFDEARCWIARALELMEGAPASVRAGVYNAAGLIAHVTHDLEWGKQMQEKALAIHREIGDQRDIGWSLTLLSGLSMGQREEYEQAIANCEESLALLSQVGDIAGVTQTLNIIGELARLQGNFDRAERAYMECLEIARQTGDTLREAMQAGNLAFLALAAGDIDRAEVLILQGLSLSLEMEYRPLIISYITYLASLLSAQGKLERAARIIGMAERLLDTYGITLQLSDQPMFDDSKVSVIERLGSESYQTAYEEGQAMSLADAVTHALNQDR